MNDLSFYRKQLDQIDEELMNLLVRRFAICREVAQFKARTGTPMMQPARVIEVKERAAARAANAGLQSQFGADLYDVIIREACRLEDDIINQAESVG